MVLEEVPFNGVAPIKAQYLRRNIATESTDAAKTEGDKPKIGASEVAAAPVSVPVAEIAESESRAKKERKDPSGDGEGKEPETGRADETEDVHNTGHGSDAEDGGDGAEQNQGESGDEKAESKAEGSSSAGAEDPKKRKRGMNKNRPPPSKYIRELCVAVSAGRECPFGENCKYSHDVEAYMQKKPADISDVCPIHEISGKCNFGISCRFASGHNKVIQNPKEHIDHVNSVSKELQTTLRKKKYDYTRTINVMKSIKAQPTSSEKADLSTHFREKNMIDFRGKLYLAPLTTVGNLPFRRICKRYGVDITCGEMAVSQSILQGNNAEWALLHRHPSEDIFGVQVCGNIPDLMTRCAQVIDENTSVDFVDVNSGCPVELFCMKGFGCALMERQNRIEGILRGMNSVLRCPVTIKMRIGQTNESPNAHKIIPKLKEWGAAAVTIHGRSKQQRYTKVADWDYINQCADISPIPLIGNGDILSWHDYERRTKDSKIATVMIARGGLIKPWLFTEIKERRDWDISSRERLDMLKDYVRFGLEHWGSDQKGVNNTRRFLLEWLSFLYRYIPVGLLEVIPQHMNARPLPYYGRDDLETLMGSPDVRDWVKISEMLLGPTPDDFSFIPKHKSNSYEGDSGRG